MSKLEKITCAVVFFLCLSSVTVAQYPYGRYPTTPQVYNYNYRGTYMGRAVVQPYTTTYFDRYGRKVGSSSITPPVPGQPLNMHAPSWNRQHGIR